ncbi:hypothetical protein Q0N07_14530, partial [Staphylococcus aureus]|nr:hypothetical protein [Staphylococcus aureus]
NDAVASLYGIDIPPDHHAVSRLDPADLARRCASFALGRALGRWGGDVLDEGVLEIRPASSRLVARLRDELAELGGGVVVDEVERGL